MTNYTDIAARYIDTWNTTDPNARKAGVVGLWTQDGSYTDPLADAQGPEAIDATIGAVQAQFPTFRFRLNGAVDGHHNQVRFGWELGPEGLGDGDAAPIAGFDVAVLDDDGRIQSVHGFLDRVPS